MPSASPLRSVARIAALSLCALALGAPAGCDKGGDAHGKGPPKGKGAHAGKGERAQVLAVETISLEPARIERHYRTSGTLRAIREADIVATQLAIIRTMEVEEGDTVEKGQTLARLDGRDLKLQAAAAGVTLENLERELGRLESVSREAIALEEIDKQRYAVEEARAAAKLTRHQATQTTVRAPFTGTIVERYVDQGNLATTTTPLLRIADLSILELQLHVPERDAASVRVGTPVEIELVDHTRFTAEVFRKAPVVDELTGTVKLTVHAQSYPEAAMPGAFARASILVDARDEAPSLARSAIFEVEGEPHVYVIVDGKARRRAVELGLQGSERAEVVSGLSVDDVVVADGNGGITEGMPLRRAGADGKPGADKIAGEPPGSDHRPGA
jgi:membrane fusion protein, multidrug efflux system